MMLSFKPHVAIDTKGDWIMLSAARPLQFHYGFANAPLRDKSIKPKISDNHITVICSDIISYAASPL